MSKAELYAKAKKYYNILENTVKSNKQNKKENRGHLIFDKGSHPAVVTTSALTVCLGLGFALYALAGLPPYVAIPVGTASALAESFAVPKMMHHLILHGKGKFARGYAKMELDNYFVAFKDYVKEHQKEFLKSNIADEVSLEDLEEFVNVFENCTENYKNTLDKLIGKKIFKRNQEDLKKVSQIIKKSKNDEKTAKKIEKIVKRNEKFVKPWCDLYNKCGSIAKNLFNSCKDMDSSFVVPKENEFRADSKFVSKKIDSYLKTGYEVIEIAEKVTFEEAQPKEQKIHSPQKVSKYERIREYLAKRESKNQEESFER